MHGMLVAVIVFTMNDFIAWLSLETERQGWSLQQMARRVGVSRVDITRIAKGQMRPSADLCRQVAMIFNIPPVEVFRRAGFLPPELKETSLLQKTMHLIG